MEFSSGINVFRSFVVLIFFLGVCVAHAATPERETGFFSVVTTGPGNPPPNYVFLHNKTIPAAGTGTARCSYGLVTAPLSSAGAQAMLSEALAANFAVKQVTITYIYDPAAGYTANCLLIAVRVD